MKFNKVSLCFMSILLISYLLLPANVIAADQWKGDNFDSYPVGVWSPPTNGWQSLYSRAWYITYGVLTGKVLWFTPNESDVLVHPVDASDYRISVQIQHSSYPTNFYQAGLIARRSDNVSYYSSFIYRDINSNMVRLALAKNWKEGSYTYRAIMNSIDCFDGDYNTAVYYTISLSVQGNDLAATFSFPSGLPFLVSYRDDGSTYGPVLTGGYVGVFSDAEVSFHPYFDNFTYAVVYKRPQPWLPLLLGD